MSQFCNISCALARAARRGLRYLRCCCGRSATRTFDGVRVLEPWVAYLKPMHENPELFWFARISTGRSPSFLWLRG